MNKIPPHSDFHNRHDEITSDNKYDAESQLRYSREINPVDESSTTNAKAFDKKVSDKRKSRRSPSPSKRYQLPNGRKQANKGISTSQSHYKSAQKRSLNLTNSKSNRDDNSSRGHNKNGRILMKLVSFKKNDVFKINYKSIREEAKIIKNIIIQDEKLRKFCKNMRKIRKSKNKSNRNMVDISTNQFNKNTRELKSVKTRNNNDQDIEQSYCNVSLYPNAFNKYYQNKKITSPSDLSKVNGRNKFKLKAIIHNQNF